MSARSSLFQEITPAAPDNTIRELLAVTVARSVPLRAGDTADGQGPTGEYVLVAALRGSLSVTSATQYALLQQGQVLVLRSPGKYTLQAVTEALANTVQLRGYLPERLLQEKLVENAAVLPQCASAVRELVSTLTVLDQEHPPVSSANASAYAYRLLMKLHGLRPQTDPQEPTFSPLVDSAIAIIQEEFPFLESLDELSQRLEVSKAHLIRTFTQKVGISPGKYLTRVRIDYAKLLLQDQDVSIAYVAEASGFSGSNYFAKVFRKLTGMSPTEYMEGAAQKDAKFLRENGPTLW
jgi:AraC-like DNA-binding protein